MLTQYYPDYVTVDQVQELRMTFVVRRYPQYKHITEYVERDVQRQAAVALVEYLAKNPGKHLIPKISTEWVPGSCGETTYRLEIKIYEVTGIEIEGGRS